MKLMSGWIFILIFLTLIGFMVNLSDFAAAQSNTVCCEKTLQGAFCQNVPQEECNPGFQSVPTACESTSFCKPGTCYDSNEGVCLDNTPQLVCNDNGGIWSEESPLACELGCCILGDQAAFVTLVRCKKLSAQLGLETNYDKGLGNELACIQAVQAQDKGACVFEFEFETTCKFTTRNECEGVENVGINGTIASGTFFKDKLCSAEELSTNCGPSTKTTCVPGKDEVYFIDTCSNPANIYDSSKINDQDYWTNVKSKEESCGFGSSNAENPGCGSCNYLKGSYCRSQDIVKSGSTTYGDFICADLNCKDEDGQSRLHGESWCANDPGFSDAESRIGSRHFKRICINGEVVVETCADFRAEECIEDDINGFSQAACRVNRWQDCVVQADKQDCENKDRRDCVWKEGLILSNSSVDGSCLPKNPPGLKFWEDAEGQSICSQGNTLCVVGYEKGIFGGKECVENCECLTEEWEEERSEVCRGLGDCGPGVNWIGKEGNKKGFKIKIGNVE